jgi:hypothetical protein
MTLTAIPKYLQLKDKMMLDLTKILQVGDKVQTTDVGEGTVLSLGADENYPIEVAFKHPRRFTYTAEGRFVDWKADPVCDLKPVGFESWEGLAASRNINN